MGQFKLKRSASATQPFYFTVVAKGNGETLVTSETYTTRENAINGMQALVTALDKGPFEYDDLTE